MFTLDSNSDSDDVWEAYDVSLLDILLFLWETEYLFILNFYRQNTEDYMIEKEKILQSGKSEHINTGTREGTLIANKTSDQSFSV